MKPALRTLLAVAVGLSLGALGCRTPFSPASPERPTVANVRPNYVTSQAVLNTLVDAMADKGLTNGSAAYSDAFDASFVATVEPEIAAIYAARFGGTLPTWGRDQESRFYTSFVQRFPSGDYLLTFSRDEQLPVDEDDPSDNQVTLYRYYTIEFVEQDAARVICEGNADIRMRVADGRYAIISWADHFDRSIGPNPSDDRLSWGSRRYEAY